MRRDITDAAFVCFAAKGYHGTGIADIAAKLGIGHGTFYRYFANKRDIIDHVIEQLVGQLLAALTVQAVEPPAETLQEYRAQTVRVSDALSRIYFADPRIPRLMLFEATGIDSELTERMFQVHDTVVTVMSDNLKYGVKRGFLRADLDVQNTARAVVGMIIAGMLQGLRTGVEERVRSLENAVISLVFDGIVARKD
jgi:AcrR family transcriptional regulator